MDHRILELEDVLEGLFNLLILLMWKLRPREGDTLTKVTQQN